MADDIPVMLTQANIAELVGVSRQRIGQIVATGRLKPSALLSTGSWLFNMADIDNFKPLSGCVGCGGEWSGPKAVRRALCETCRVGRRAQDNREHIARLHAKSKPDPELCRKMRAYIASVSISQSKLAAIIGTQQTVISCFVRGSGYVCPKAIRAVATFLESPAKA